MSDPQADPTPPLQPDPGALDRALALVEFLRAHCSWDAAQTPRSLRRHLLEESHEVIEAIEAGNEPALQEELGDLLLNLAFQIVLGEERHAFDRDDVVQTLESKIRRRHPHLFGGDAEGWEEIKRRERSAGAGLLSDLDPGTDPLAHAERIQKRVATIGFDWPDAVGAWEKVLEELEEVKAEFIADDPVRLEEEIGDLFFALINFARLAGIHPSTALRGTNARFSRRFARLEQLASARGLPLESSGLEVLDGLWRDVKKEEG